MNIKLQTALIEIGKEMEKLTTTPTADEIEAEHIALNVAIYNGDPKAIRKHGRKLCALTTKYMVDKL